MTTKASLHSRLLIQFVSMFPGSNPVQIRVWKRVSSSLVILRLRKQGVNASEALGEAEL
jgi:hypothetical protein